MFNEETYPKIDGATAAIPLGQIVAINLLGIDPIDARALVSFNTTHDAYVNLLEQKADIIFCAEPSNEEKALAQSKGISLKLTPIGVDAFVMAL